MTTNINTNNNTTVLFRRMERMTDGLLWGYRGGEIFVSGKSYFISDGIYPLLPRRTNYLESDALGILSVNTEGPTPGKLLLYTIVTNSKEITDYTDNRSSMGMSALFFQYSAMEMFDDNVILTQSQSFCETLECTGILTAPRNLITAAIHKRFVVFNNTEGGFAITIKTPNGRGVTVPVGGRYFVEVDRENVNHVNALSSSNAPDFAANSVLTYGLYYGHNGGIIRADNVTTPMSCGSVLLFPNAVNYVEASGLGVVSTTVAGFTSGKFPMAQVVTDIDSIVSMTDERGFVNVTPPIITGSDGNEIDSTTLRTSLSINQVDNTSDMDKPLSHAQSDALTLKQNLNQKDKNNGYAGLTNLKINLVSTDGNTISYLKNDNPDSRTYTLPNKDIVVAGISDITGLNSGVNTGDETKESLQSKLDISILSGDNTGDETLSSLMEKLSLTVLSGENTGDESADSIKQKLNITTLSGTNTGDQSLQSLGAVASSDKDTSNGYPGLSELKINFKNSGNTITSHLSNENLASRDYLFPDKNITVAGLSDITGTNSGVNTGDETKSGLLTKLELTVLSGNNTGDETTASVKAKLSIDTLTGENTGDETNSTLLSKLGVNVLSGANTGDQSLDGLGGEARVNKDTSNGYVGLTQYKINIRNAANSITSFIGNTNTVSRNYTFPDKDITLAGLSDITGLNSGVNTGDETIASIQSKLGITGLSGNNTGDQSLESLGAESIANRDYSGGYVGLTLMKINFKNTGNTTISFLSNANTLSRNYLFPDKSITVAGLDDITGTNSGINTGDQTLGSLGAEAIINKNASNGYVGLTLLKVNFKNTQNTFTSFLSNTNSAVRNYTFPDKDIVVAGLADITGNNSGINTGDESTASIKTKLSITTLSGVNTGDQSLGSLGGEAITNRDASNGYAGLTLFKINFQDPTNSFTSYLTNANTAPRVYTYPNKDITIAGLSDITGVNSGTNSGDETGSSIRSKLQITTLSGSNTGDQTLAGLGGEATINKDVSNGYVGMTLYKVNFRNGANTFTSFLTNSNTGARTYTYPDKDITVAGIVDITGTNSGINTGDESAATIKAKLGVTVLSGSNTGDQVVGTIASQNANAVAITGGAIDGTSIGATTRNTVKATQLDANYTTITTAPALQVTYNQNRTVTASDIPTGSTVNFSDSSTGNRLSAQVSRFTYTRNASTSGIPTSFDAVIDTVISMNESMAAPLRSLNIEGPVVASGKTLSSHTGLYIGAPSGAGTVTSSRAITTEATAGNTTLGTTTDNGVDRLQASGSGSFTGPVKHGQYTVATLPSAAAFNGYHIDVTDALLGPKTCRSDGTSWKILNSLTLVS